MTSDQFDRFVANIHFVERDEDFGECWEWTGNLRAGQGNRTPYGRMRIDGHWKSAHRVAYEHFVGPIADDREIDHLCRNTRCVNPSHLEPVTKTVNIRRGLGPAVAAITLKRRTDARTHCSNGHPYDALTYQQKRGGRRCRECQRAAAARWYQHKPRKVDAWFAAYTAWQDAGVA